MITTDGGSHARGVDRAHSRDCSAVRAACAAQIPLPWNVHSVDDPEFFCALIIAAMHNVIRMQGFLPCLYLLPRLRHLSAGRRVRGRRQPLHLQKLLVDSTTHCRTRSSLST